MAECVVSFLVEKLNDLLVSEAAFLAEVGNDIEWMERELRRMQCFLKDADTKQDKDARVQNWVREIREVSFEAEDVIDTFLFKFGGRRFRTGFRNSFKRYAQAPLELYARHDIGKEIETIKRKISEISLSRTTYGIESFNGGNQGQKPVEEHLRERRRMPVFSEDEDIVGFVKDAEKLENLLLGLDQRRLVVSIVGMGGLGKSTLAKKLFTSVGTREFGCCVWISLSQESKASDVLQDIARKAMNMKKQEVNNMDREELERKLYEFLESRRYLFVLDDVWEKKTWDCIKSCLPDTKNRSRVMITTRFRECATHAVPCFPPHELNVLGEDESWELLKKKAFADQDEIKSGCNKELVNVGKQIVRNCGGLPLALVVLGGLLAGKERIPSSWLKTVQGLNWQKTETGRQCLDILALSYDDLPYHLKWCFLYLSSFPEDYEIEAGKLTRLWIAEGFVQKSEGETLEETGERYLEELIQRCMVQVVSKNLLGGVEKCRVHDLLHGLSISEARETNFFHVNGETDQDTSVPIFVRRLAVHKDMRGSYSNSVQKIRTLLDFSKSCIDIKEFSLLRVMDLEGTPIDTLPGEIGTMVHLRYLGLRETRLRKLPSSTSYLKKLQTLDVRNTDVDQLPDGVWTIKGLRHIYGNWLRSPLDIGGDGQSHLQTLEAVSAGPWIANSLESLTKLCTLCVFRFEVDKSYANTLVVALATFHHLNTLQLFASGGNSPLPLDLLKAISNLDHLRVLSLRGSMLRANATQKLPTNLVKVSLKFTRLAWRPFWELLERLNFLRILVLNEDAIADTQLICAARGFPRLQELSLDKLKIEHWWVEDGAMPSLRYLCINRCLALMNLPVGLKRVTSLQKVELENMSAAFIRTIQQEDWKKIQHVSSVTMNGRVLP